ncbi:MAG: tol-pal system protein YbgF [Proteobacteria bacterium]|nr:tol-pal system protein YbgF [Pseudomonadota bacterium]
MKGTAKAIFGSAVVVATLLTAQLAMAQSRNEFRALLQRVESLEKELQTLRRGGTSVQTQASRVGGNASLEALVERQETMGADLDRQVREVTNTVERVRFEVGKISQRTDKLVRDVDQRLLELEAKVAATQAAGPAATPEVNPVASSNAASPPASSASAEANTTTGVAAAAANVLPQGTPVEQYEKAFALLRQLKFAEAEVALKAFLDQHPNHELADNSRYWLGETHYVRKEYETAARIFLEGYQSNKAGRKAADNLLKLGLSLRKLGQKEDACATLNELLGGYPLADKKLLGRARTELSELGCS